MGATQFLQVNDAGWPRSTFNLHRNSPITKGLSDGRVFNPRRVHSGSEFLDFDYVKVIPAIRESRSYDQRTSNRTEKFKGADSTALKENKVAATPINGNYDAGAAPKAKRDVKRISYVVRALERRLG